MARLKDYYQKELVAKLKTELGLENIIDVPAIKKITLNMGVGDAA
ncbi:50S ribosomal protein L5, partial [Francisella tularensis subsp. holarctica]|nr:50S ribosomal protein L5 [Francisella tularensis subsp. holarctica]